MKITTMELTIDEKDFDLYEANLLDLGWVEESKYKFKKMFGKTEVMVGEHTLTFSSKVSLHVTFYNPEGCSIEDITLLLNDLKSADKTPDDE